MFEKDGIPLLEAMGHSRSLVDVTKVTHEVNRNRCYWSAEVWPTVVAKGDHSVIPS